MKGIELLYHRIDEPLKLIVRGVLTWYDLGYYWPLYYNVSYWAIDDYDIELDCAELADCLS